MDVDSLRAALPLHTGETITEAKFDELHQNVVSVVQRVTGAPPTDLSAICCGTNGGLMIYIGLHGKNSHALTHLPAPAGSECLPSSAVDLYNKAIDEVMPAVQTNDAGEDDSRGYALSHYPALRQAQLALRDYAVGHTELLQKTLRDCREQKNREAAAHLLGYANRSKQQVAALLRACADPDATVRNNAIRALWVLASSSRNAANTIPAHRFVELLNSDKWEDRNKAGLLLTALVKYGSPTLLRDLRSNAFDSLLEMARWHDPGHAGAYCELLGKIAGFDDGRIHRLIAAGKVEEIISAAEKSLPAKSQ